MRQLCDVSSFGASGDGLSDDTKAIQNALNGGNKTIFFPDGIYRISAPLLVFSGTHILAPGNVIVRLADGAGSDASVFVLTNQDQINGNSDINIEGGVWDSNCAGNPRGEEYAPNSYSGCALNFVKVKRLELKNLTTRNPDAFHIRLGETEDFLIENICFDATEIRLNQDGVHVGGYCSRGRIRGLRAISPYGTNDDMVALNADDDVTRQFNQGMKCGPISDIIVENLYADSAYTFLRILSNESPIRNIEVSKIFGGVRTNVLNINRWRFAEGGGDIKDVRIRDVRARKMPPAAIPGGGCGDSALIDIDLKVKNFVVERFTRLADDMPNCPTLSLCNKCADNHIIAEGVTSAQGAPRSTENFEVKGAQPVLITRGGFTKLIVK